MKNSIGTSVIFSLFGESHGEYIGGVIDGLTPGIKFDEEFLKTQLAKRRPSSLIDTSRIENDDYQIISGIYNGYTTGSPIAIIIKNNNVKSDDYNLDIPRPSHVDYVSHIKYHGYGDLRGGGHFSGRLTAPIVALGSICLKALESKGIKIGTHILKCGEVNDSSFKDYEKEIDIINNKNIPVIKDIEKDLENEILKYKNDKDSVGGIIETAIIGLPTGIGEPWFSSLEGIISNAIFSIGGIKGIAFGAGFDFANGSAKSLNDNYHLEDDKIVTSSNFNGGINGGISNGNPITFKMVVKPTPSIASKQTSVNLKTNEEVELEIKGRHDPAIIRRISVVINNLLAIVIADELEKKFGVDYFLEK